MCKKILQSVLAAILAVSFSVPLAACQQAGTTKTQTSGETWRWENFDDGSDVLDVDVPYIPSNTDSTSFKVILEKGKLAADAGADKVSLAGALEGWSVDAAERTDDVTLAIKASRPEGLANNGASLVSVTLAEGCVTDVDTDTGTDTGGGTNAADAGSGSGVVFSSGEDAENSAGRSKDETMSADEVNDDKGVEWPDDAEIVNKDEEAFSAQTDERVANTPEEVSSLLGEVESGAVDSEDDLKPYEEREAGEQASEQAGEADAADDAASGADAQAEGDAATDDGASQGYEVLAVFANPALSVDFENSKIDGTTFAATLSASDFVVGNGIGTDSFTLQDADGCALSAASFKNEREIAVEISLPQDKGASALDGATLMLKAEANETQGDVACAIAVPKPWVSLDFDYTDEAAGTTTFTACVRDGQGALSAGNVKIEVDGNEIAPSSVAAQDDGTYSVVLKTGDVPSGSAVVLTPSGIRDLLGRDAEPAQVAAIAEETEEQARGLIDDFTPENMAAALGKKALFALVSHAWKEFYTNAADPNRNTSLYDASNNEILSEVIQIHDQVTDLGYEMKALSTTVRAGQKAALVTDAERLAARIRTQYTLLKDEVDAIYTSPDGSQRSQQFSDFARKEKTMLDELATNMGELYTIICKADAASGHDIVEVYDELMALSYNWGIQTYNYRRSFRGSLATIWTNAAEVLRVAYGAQTEDAEAGKAGNLGSKRSYLDELDAQGKKVNEIVNEKHKIDLDVCRRGGSWGKLSQYGTYTYHYTDDYFKGFIDVANDSIENPKERAAEVARIEETWQAVMSMRKIGAGSSPLVLYCNTTGDWCQTLVASDTQDKWDKGFVYHTGSWTRNTIVAHLASPFRTYEYREVGSLMKFVATTSWDSSYLNTAQVNAMLSKLPDGKTLKSELEDVGLKTAKYLVSSERFDDTFRVVYDNNDWYFDTFEVAKSTNKDKGFTKEKKHYDGSYRYVVVTKVKHVNWKTSPGDMFTLNKTTVKPVS